MASNNILVKVTNAQKLESRENRVSSWKEKAVTNEESRKLEGSIEMNNKVFQDCQDGKLYRKNIISSKC